MQIDKTKGAATAAAALKRSKEIQARTAHLMPPKTKPQAKSKINLEEDAESKGPTNAQLSQVADYCRKVSELQERLAKGAEYMAKYNTELAKILEVDIPELMKTAGLKTITLDDGRKVEVVNKIFPSYTEANKPRVFDWFRKNDLGSIIKNVIEVKFDKGEDEKAAALLKLLEAKKYKQFAQLESIHASTFKSTIADLMEQGKKLPKIISIFEKPFTNIKETKNGNPSKKDSGKNVNSRSKADLF